MTTSVARARRVRVATLLVIVAIAAVPVAGGAGSLEPPPRQLIERMRGIADASRPSTLGEVHLKRAGDEVEATTGAEARDLSGYFASPEDARNPSSYMEAATALFGSITGSRIRSGRQMLAASRPSGGGLASEDDAETETDFFPAPAGDLDGDGVADALSLEVEYDPWSYEVVSFGTTAARGLDGTPLWSADLGDPYDTALVPLGDMTGDGRDDLIVWEFTFDDGGFLGGCAVVGCAIAGSVSYHWTIRLVSGADGAQVWTRRFDGAWTEGYAFGGGLAAVGLADAYTLTNALVLPIPSGDHDGDGAADLVIDALDVSGVFGLAFAGIFVGAFTYADVFLTATRAEVVTGPDGTTIFERRAENQPGVALLEPAGNTAGDATTDLLWQEQTITMSPVACVFALVAASCAQMQRTSLDLEMIDGSTRDTAWATTIADPLVEYAYAVPAEADLSGGGADDLLLHEYTPVGRRLGAISGSDGTVTWRRTLLGAYTGVAVIGPVGGEPGVDVLVAAFGWTYEGATVTLDRLDGATGAIVQTSNRTGQAPASGFADLWVYLMGDADGDGALDIVIENIVFDFDTWEVDAVIQVESGAATTELARHEGDGSSWVYGVDDLTGDGNADLLRLGAGLRRTGFEITTEAIAMPSNEVAWARADRFLPDFFAWLRIAPDVTGNGGDDLMVAEWQDDDGDVQSRFEVWDGTSGATAWIRGDTFTVVPPPGTGSFSGRVTDTDGNPLEGICVTPFSTTGVELLPEVTGADGTYRVDELHGAAYLVRLIECWWGDGIVETRWFDGKESFETADEVLVLDDEDTPGIDAALPALPGPVNDLIADALVIDAVPYTDERSTRGASTESGEQSPCGAIGSTVWYRYTPAADGVLDIDTFDSGYDTVLAAYEGDDGPAALLDCNDDSGFSLASSLTIQVVAGSTYWIQAGGFAGDQGRLALHVE